MPTTTADLGGTVRVGVIVGVAAAVVGALFGAKTLRNPPAGDLVAEPRRAQVATTPRRTMAKNKARRGRPRSWLRKFIEHMVLAEFGLSLGTAVGTEWPSSSVRTA